MSHPVKVPKKLIEVALPLDVINKAAGREKSIRHGHPSTLHLWWARRPLAAARAVIFAQLVNDPASLWEMQNPGQTPSLQQRGGFTQRRRYLFDLLEELVQWKNTRNAAVLKKARKEIRDSWREVCSLNADHPEAETLFNPDKLPGLHDPFAGGGTIPLEAQRLGLDAYASDLNPVAVVINKAMIEIPPRFADRPPVHPEARKGGKLSRWKGAAGLAEDVRHYGAWMRQEAERRIGHLYPKATITAQIVAERPELQRYEGQDLTVIAWLWARTVKSPNPAFSHVDVPLVTSFVLGRKDGKEAWVEPVVDGDQYRFEVRTGKPPKQASKGTKAPGRGANFRCVLSGVPIEGDYIKAEGRAGRIGARLMAVVAEGNRERVYLSSDSEMEAVAEVGQPSWSPSGLVPPRLTGGTCVPYGMTEWGDLFTTRQLSVLGTFVGLVAEAATQAQQDAEAASLDGEAWSRAIATYLTFLVSKQVESSTTLCTWSSHPKNELVVSTFRRQALPMTWDFAETNPFANSSGSIQKNLDAIARGIERSLSGAAGGEAKQQSAQSIDAAGRFVSTDPPYYDNISYADLSDFFYVWMRRSLRDVYPDVFSTIAVPKLDELVATPYRHGSRAAAEHFFLQGMSQVMEALAQRSHLGGPLTIYYAFKQGETDRSGEHSSTGWETFLEAVLQSGLAVTGTWPMRTERPNRSVGVGTNALASSIVLVCRKRPETAPSISRRQFLRELDAVLPDALDEMTRGAGDERSPVAPVDLSQAIIGPGMAVFSKYAAVLEADGTPMSVKGALKLINRFLAEDDFDADTQFCLHWFDQQGWSEGQYGEADVLARAKATSVGGLDQAGVLISGSGKVRLRKWSEYPSDWDPRRDKRLPVWEALHQLIRAFRQEGETGAGQLLAAVKDHTDAVRQLAYRLYTLCERRGWAEDARAYNDLVTAWAAVETVANTVPDPQPQLNMFGES